jgi:hypothetical protein
MTLNEKIRNNIAKGLVLLTLSAGAVGCTGTEKKEKPEPVKDTADKYLITLYAENGSVISRDTVDYNKDEIISYDEGVIRSMYSTGAVFKTKNAYTGTIKVELMAKK